MARKKTRQKEYHVSIYGEVEVRKRQRVRVKHPRYKVKYYYRTRTRREERRWDLRGSKADVRIASARIGRYGIAPRKRFQRVRTKTYLRNPRQYEDEDKPLLLEQEYRKRRFRIWGRW